MHELKGKVLDLGVISGPFPPGLPFIALLIVPWLSFVKDEFDLSDRYSELFSDAVIAFSSTATNDRGLIERTLDYQDQATAWFGLRAKFTGFVDAAVESSHRTVSGPNVERITMVIDFLGLSDDEKEKFDEAIHVLTHPLVNYEVINRCR